MPTTGKDWFETFCREINASYFYSNTCRNKLYIHDVPMPFPNLLRIVGNYWFWTVEIKKVLRFYFLIKMGEGDKEALTWHSYWINTLCYLNRGSCLGNKSIVMVTVSKLGVSQLVFPLCKGYNMFTKNTYWKVKFIWCYKKRLSIF